MEINLGIPAGLNDAPPPPPPDQPPGSAKLSDEELVASSTFNKAERGIKKSFDINSKTWVETEVNVEIAQGYFARGVARIAFWMNEIDLGSNEKKRVVAKFLDDKFLRPIVGPVTREMYYNDCMSQVVSRRFSQLYNSQDPPKPILMLPMYVIELCDRQGSPLCLVEPVLKGEFVKHNNNNGDVLSASQTPQAFSHFSYEASNYQLVVVDVQGVGEVYTDPQIHSINPREFGLGNQNIVGIQRFLQTHTCNGVCLALGLTKIDKGHLVEPWSEEMKNSVLEGLKTQKQQQQEREHPVEDYDKLMEDGKCTEPKDYIFEISPSYGNGLEEQYDYVCDTQFPSPAEMKMMATTGMLPPFHAPPPPMYPHHHTMPLARPSYPPIHPVYPPPSHHPAAFHPYQYCGGGISMDNNVSYVVGPNGMLYPMSPHSQSPISSSHSVASTNSSSTLSSGHEPFHYSCTPWMPPQPFGYQPQQYPYPPQQYPYPPQQYPSAMLPFPQGMYPSQFM